MTAPYASTHGRRYRMRRFPANAGMPRFVTKAGPLGFNRGSRTRASQSLSFARAIRLLSVAQGICPPPPLVGDRRWSVPRRRGLA